MRKIQKVFATFALGTVAGLAQAGDAPILQASNTKIEAVSNQALANELAGLYRTSGSLAGYSVDIQTAGGVVTLVGSVADSNQHAALMNMTRRHPGVVAVNDKIAVRKTDDLIVAGFQDKIPKPLAGGIGAPASESRMGAVATEPAPTAAFPGGVMPYTDAPALPPYAWPAYTPYNNYASMAQQTQYPSGAWPFIGPPYPYPMIPAGWRRVSLNWKCGYWYMKFHAH